MKKLIDAEAVIKKLEASVHCTAEPEWNRAIKHCINTLLRAAESEVVDVNAGLYWIIYFEDKDRPIEVFNDETAARETHRRYLNNWSCHLFVQAEALTAYQSNPQAVSTVDELDEALQLIHELCLDEQHTDSVVYLTQKRFDTGKTVYQRGEDFLTKHKFDERNAK